MTEAQFQKQVVDLAQRCGWLVAHFATAPTRSGHWSTPVRADGKGFPDLVLARDRVVFAELKTKYGTIRPAQTMWLTSLEEAGQEAYLWRPGDFDEIVKVLK